ncbi:MAG: DUF2891 domain-containing protein, partial [Akkermansiaceae bacterium]|nr:DUF2891 domain-containing protein [Akkermansiaceae bacterium]
AADAHTREGLALVASGHYEGEHWLASFAVYLLTGVGVDGGGGGPGATTPKESAKKDLPGPE